MSDAKPDHVANRLGQHSRLMVCLLALVVYLSSSAGGSNANNLILSGIIVAAILSAGISSLKFVADEQVSVFIFWLLGSFASKTWIDAGLTFFFLLIGTVVFLFYPRDLNVLCMGRRAAASLGVDVRRVPWILLVTASPVAATYGYVLKNVQALAPDAPVVSVPGISACQASAARVNRPLVEGEESLPVLSL